MTASVDLQPKPPGWRSQRQIQTQPALRPTPPYLRLRHHRRGPHLKGPRNLVTPTLCVLVAELTHCSTGFRNFADWASKAPKRAKQKGRNIMCAGMKETVTYYSERHQNIHPKEGNEDINTEGSSPEKTSSMQRIWEHAPFSPTSLFLSSISACNRCSTDAFASSTRSLCKQWL